MQGDETHWPIIAGGVHIQTRNATEREQRIRIRSSDDFGVKNGQRPRMVSRRVCRVGKGFPPLIDVATGVAEINVIEEVLSCGVNPAFEGGTA